MKQIKKRILNNFKVNTFTENIDKCLEKLNQQLWDLGKYRIMQITVLDEDYTYIKTMLFQESNNLHTVKHFVKHEDRKELQRTKIQDITEMMGEWDI